MVLVKIAGENIAYRQKVYPTRQILEILEEHDLKLHAISTPLSVSKKKKKRQRERERESIIDVDGG